MADFRNRRQREWPFPKMADILEFLNQGRYRGRIRGTKAFVLLEILTATRSKNV